jgi:hypothetical protein
MPSGNLDQSAEAASGASGECTAELGSGWLRVATTIADEICEGEDRPGGMTFGYFFPSTTIDTITIILFWRFN